MNERIATLRNALVVGGGVAGLSAAVALGRRGVAVTVLDLHGQADGASIGIMNRAVDALEELGVLPQCLEQSIVLEGTGSIFQRMYDSAGQPLQVPVPPPRKDTRLPSGLTIFRPELARVLTEAAQASGASIRIGETIESLRDHGDHVDVTLKGGAQASFDLVIGADGTYSAVRPMIHPVDVKPQYSGHMSFRWIIKDGPKGNAGFYTRADNHMVAVGKLPGGWTYVATGIDMESRRLEQAEARTLLAGILRSYESPFLRALADAVDEHQTIIVRPYDWIWVSSPWHRGRVTLIGDAAHSSTAHLSSGGGMALEDSAVLAQELAAAADVGTALDRFMKRREPRARMVVETGVELLRLQQVGASPAASGALRAKAYAMLQEPY